MEVTEELRRLRQRAGLSMAELATAIGYKTASGYQRYENDQQFEKPYLPMTLTRKLVDVLEGRGDPPITNIEIMKLSGIVSGDVEGWEFLEASLPFRIPVFLQDQLSDNILSGENSTRRAYQQKTFADGVGENAFCIEITDDSMSSSDKSKISIEEGDRIICVPDKNISPGDIVVGKRCSDEIAIIRKYRLIGHDHDGNPIIDLVPLNPDYPTISLNSDNPGRIIARVREVRKTL